MSKDRHTGLQVMNGIRLCFLNLYVRKSNVWTRLYSLYNVGISSILERLTPSLQMFRKVRSEAISVLQYLGARTIKL
jgi:hypothetical protein